MASLTSRTVDGPFSHSIPRMVSSLSVGIGLLCLAMSAPFLMSFYPIRQHYTNYFVQFQRKTSYFFENFLQKPVFQAKRPLIRENTGQNFAVFISYLVLCAAHFVWTCAW